MHFFLLFVIHTYLWNCVGFDVVDDYFVRHEWLQQSWVFTQNNGKPLQSVWCCYTVLLRVVNFECLFSFQIDVLEVKYDKAYDIRELDEDNEDILSQNYYSVVRVDGIDGTWASQYFLPEDWWQLRAKEQTLKQQRQVGLQQVNCKN